MVSFEDRKNNMENKKIEKADFTQEALEEHYYQCEFSKCYLSDMKIGKVIFEECTFKECNFSLAKVHNASWQNVIFEGCKMTGMDFTGSNKFSLSLEFNNCLLSYVLFTGMNLKDTRFSNCDLQTADFTDTDLTNSAFVNCDLSSTAFYHTNLEKADLTLARNYSISAFNNRLKNARFSRYGLEGLLAGTGVEIID